MTVLLNNNFDGGVTGSQITTSNSGADNGNAFTYVSQTNSGVCQYADVAANGLNRETAQYVMAMSTGATAGPTAYVGWNASSLGTLTTFWTRFYFYVSALSPTGPNDDTNLFSAYLTSGVPGVTIFLQCNPAPPYNLYIWNGYSSVQTTMVTALAAGIWNRVEFTATLGTSTGSASMSLYQDPNSDGAVPTETISQSGQNYGTSTINTTTLGMDYGSGQNNTPVIYFSNWQMNNSGYPGPAPFRAGKSCPGILTNPIAIHSDVC